MPYIWFWVLWLAEHAPKSVKYRFTKFGRLTGREPNEVAKIVLNLHFLTWRWILRKNQVGLSNREKLHGNYILFWVLYFVISNSKPSFKKKIKSTIQHRKWVKITCIWFWVHWLAEHIPKSSKSRFIRFDQLTGNGPKEEGKIILRLLILR